MEADEYNNGLSIIPLYFLTVGNFFQVLQIVYVTGRRQNKENNSEKIELSQFKIYPYIN